MREVPAQPVMPITRMMIPSLPPGQVSARSPEQRDQHDRQRQERDHQEPVVERRQAPVERSRRSSPTTMPDEPADHGRDERGGEADDQRDARAQDQQREHVAAVLVGAQPVEGCERRRLQDVGRCRTTTPSGPAARSTARRSRSSMKNTRMHEADGAAAALADQRQAVTGAALRQPRRRGASRAIVDRSASAVSVLAIATPCARAGRGTRRPDRPRRLADDHGRRRDEEHALQHRVVLVQDRVVGEQRRCPATRTASRPRSRPPRRSRG